MREDLDSTPDPSGGRRDGGNDSITANIARKATKASPGPVTARGSGEGAWVLLRRLPQRAQPQLQTPLPPPLVELEVKGGVDETSAQRRRLGEAESDGIEWA
jgi:hypothetical protein